MKKPFSSPYQTVEKFFKPTTLRSLEQHTPQPFVAHLPDSDSLDDVMQGFSKTLVYDLSIVTPTRNERDNVRPLLQRLKNVFAGVRVEIIFVDDSDDETPRRVEAEALNLGTSSFSVRLVYRMRGLERAGGLSTAVTLGLEKAQAPYVAVIDADLQHPPEQLRVLYDEAIAQNVDLALASRYIKGGSSGGLDGISRLFFSVGFKWVAKILFPGQLGGVSDPLGGFFLLKRSLLNGVQLRPIGYKILLEILLRCSWKEIVEVPYHFQQRNDGQSKANLKQGITALRHMARLFREVPAAGRIWKVSALALGNLLLAGILFYLYPFAASLWQSVSIAVFAVVAVLNFLLLNHKIFPLSMRQSQESSTPLVPVDHALTAVIPAVSAETMDRKHTISQQTQKHGIISSEMISVQKNVTPGSRTEKLFMLASFLLVLTTLGTIGYMALGWTLYAVPSAWVVVAAVLFGLSITIATSYKQVDFHRIITMLLAVSMGITFIDYLSWRFEVINWSGWWLALPLLVAEVLGALHTLGLQCTLWPRSQPHLQRSKNPTYAPVFIFIPTVNEGVAILEATLRGALAARHRYLSQYPWGEVNIVVCNDGYVANAPDWQVIEALCKSMGVQCVTRAKSGGAKAGNIEHARQLVGATGNALVVIFDADQIAYEEFLLKTVPYLADPHIGWVQTGQYYRNLENPVTRWADDQQAMFYNLLCPGKATWNAAFICGTNVVIRARALDEIGGLPQDSVTEDFAASISLHTRWQSVYLTDVLATGLGPMDMSAYLKQQRRWAVGTLEVIRSHWRDILLPKKDGLRLGQRVQYFLACTHYLCGVRDLLYLLCPILFIFSGVPAVHGSTLSAFLWHFLPYFLVSSATIWYAGRGITGLPGIVMSFGCFPVLVESLITVLLQRKVGFTVTSKKRGPKKAVGYLWIYLFFAFACTVALIFALQNKTQEHTTLAISVLWILYTLVMLGSFLWLYYQDWLSQRAESRSGAKVQPEQVVYPARVPMREQGLRSVGNFGLAFLLAAFIFLTGTFHSYGEPAPAYPLRLASGDKQYLGVSLPVTLLKQRPAQLEQKLGADFSIVGRTQDINDQFDVLWANNLAAVHARPWITLQFGSFLANGKPANDSSLMAIANGLHDDALRRWAQDIRAYGKPVSLTILLHVDRNWSLSSAVANGGIPQDAPRAWMHVEALFKQVGADNVSWIWSPADPAQDQLYAPPVATVDAVLLSLISYPKTSWSDPQSALRAVIQRYPGKPIFLEVSAAGDPILKAAWLTKVGAAVEKNHAVYALIYHDSSPAVSSTAAQNAQWSMTSDNASLNAMRQIANQLKR
jgi:cellulose synthase/poly-beta-1,6-N-acetylglucosamine synthase-like glycosyltransferase